MVRFGGFHWKFEWFRILQIWDAFADWILFYSLRWTRVSVLNWNLSIFRHIVKLLKWANLVVLLKIRIFRILQIWVVFADEFSSTLCAEQEYSVEKLKLKHFETHNQIVEMVRFGGFCWKFEYFAYFRSEMRLWMNFVLLFDVDQEYLWRNWNRSILRHIVKLLKWANFVVLLKIQIFRILQIWVVFADEFCSTRCAEQGYMWEIEIGAFYKKLLH